MNTVKYKKNIDKFIYKIDEEIFVCSFNDKKILELDEEIIKEAILHPEREISVRHDDSKKIIKHNRRKGDKRKEKLDQTIKHIGDQYTDNLMKSVNDLENILQVLDVEKDSDKTLSERLTDIFNMNQNKKEKILASNIISSKKNEIIDAAREIVDKQQKMFTSRSNELIQNPSFERITGDLVPMFMQLDPEVIKAVLKPYYDNKTKTWNFPTIKKEEEKNE